MIIFLYNKNLLEPKEIKLMEDKNISENITLGSPLNNMFV